MQYSTIFFPVRLPLFEIKFQLMVMFNVVHDWNDLLASVSKNSDNNYEQRNFARLTTMAETGAKNGRLNGVHMRSRDVDDSPNHFGI